MGALSLMALMLLGASSCKKDEPVLKLNVPVTPASAVSIPPDQAVVYQAFVRAASESGTFNGLLARIDSIKALGVNVLYLMPVHPIGLVKRTGSLGSPYSVRDYMDVNPEYGNQSDLDVLIAAAHKRGMAVVLDWVANHTAWDHAWIRQHPDWYTHDAAGNIVSPIPAYTDVADLNFDKAEMRLAMIAAMKYWVTDRSIDGFRCDAAEMVPDDFWAQALDTLKRTRSNLFLLAEAKKSSEYSAGFQLTYGWDFYAGLKQVFTARAAASTLSDVNASEMQDLPSGRYRLRFTTNHDFTFTEGTPPEIYGGDLAARAAFVSTLAFGATPMIYNGQEVGDRTRLSLFEKSTINWNNSPATTPFYRQILNAYDSIPALRTGTVSSASTADAVIVLRTLGTQRAAVFVNTRNAAVTITVPASWPAGTWTNALTNRPITNATSLSLPAYGYVVWRSQ